MDYSQEQKGKCSTCGFLARKAVNLTDRSPYSEAFEANRENGGGVYIQITNKSVPAPFVCFIRAQDIDAEIKKAFTALCPPHAATSSYFDSNISGDVYARASLQIFRVNRSCEQWYPYTPGFSPKEHLEEFKMLRLEELRKQYEQNVEENRRAFEGRMEQQRNDFETSLSTQLEHDRREFDASLSVQIEKDRRNWIEKRDEARDIAQQRNDKLMRGLTVAAVILALLQVLGMTKDSLLWQAAVRLWHLIFG